MDSKHTKIVASIVLGILISTSSHAQLDNLHGDEANIVTGIFSGNQLRLTFQNDGSLGYTTDGIFIGGEWPLYSQHNYLNLGAPFLGSEVIDNNNQTRHIFSTVIGVASQTQSGAGDSGPNGEWWTFLPLPGFSNPESEHVAMSQSPWTWPESWPDKHDDVNDPGWPNAWNGYFGKNQINADEECYFVVDDYQNQEFNFDPDNTDKTRGGLGMRAYIRGFQWSAQKVQDVLYMLYDFENIGTYDHKKMVFGFNILDVIGRSMYGGGDGADDLNGYDMDANLAYSYDEDDIGDGGWSPVGYLGTAFFETAGNAVDGIDNDNDGQNGAGKVITEEMFAPMVINPGDPIILIDYSTFERTVTVMPEDGVTITHLDHEYHFEAGDVFEEIPANLIDDNFNGIIDENYGYTYGAGDEVFRSFLNVGKKYIDYYTGEGLANILLDERRDDNIDNDGDWTVLTDDVGQDGLAHTGDVGEGDGIPTNGEPHFDKTDVDETDMIGLSSFSTVIYGHIPHSDDEGVWQNFIPGYFHVLPHPGDVDFTFSSGYFNMPPDQVQRFSIGLLFAVNFEQLLTTVQNSNTAYKNNYLLEQRPLPPVLTAIPGDNKVRLLWDEKAEQDIDPVTGMDFEGYKIYRSTTLNFNNQAPIAQFDLVNEYSGNSALPVNGKAFYLGDNTGIQHEYIDNNVVNGQDYYYAMTAYDHGAPELGIPPAESRIYFDSEIEKYDSHIVLCMPRDPNTSGSTLARHIKGPATGQVHLMVVDRRDIKLNHTYRITFADTIEGANRITKNFTLLDLTEESRLFNAEPVRDAITGQSLAYVADGFRIDFENPPVFAVNEHESGWNDPLIYDFYLERFRYSRTEGYQEAADYQIEFGEVGIDTSLELVVSSTRTLPPTPVNFKVKNLTTDKYINFGFWERDVLPGQEGKFTGFTDRTRTDEIIFLDDTLGITWDFRLINESLLPEHRNPQAGDMVKIVLDKPFTSSDVYEMTMPLDFAAVETQEKTPDYFELSQNYPNPFNACTTISFSLPEPAHVKLEIYNTLGQKVRTLLDAPKDAGIHTYQWDSTDMNRMKFASGLYFYRLEVSSKSETFTDFKKMIIVK
ncbi:T9SS C-terminal target domain-containing protein [candidate division KSB1 bacterium]|nr:T9SS type A sorting domain-containing protein [candidate division KSB1 bacterium]RQW04402.1 MAG: T9SS C-terminal target domain-containing protein [candidate division KSB1 bacterium]